VPETMWKFDAPRIGEPTLSLATSLLASIGEEARFMRSQTHLNGSRRGARQSRLISPANRPVNALTRNAAGLPCPINNARIPKENSTSSFSVRIPWSALGGEL
jgi:hypothetical protein